MIKDVQSVRKQYPPGTKVELIEMAGEPQMLSGLKGEVRFVDDIGQIHCAWENGSSLALVPEEDRFRVVGGKVT